MSSDISLNPESQTFGQNDRNGLVLFGSALLHVILIMGVGFTYTLDRPDKSASDSIATTIATSGKTEDSVEDTELFADVAQEGGGLGDTEAPVRSPLPVLPDPATQQQALSPESGRQSDQPEQEILLIAGPDSIFFDPLEDRDNPEADEGDVLQEGATAMLRSTLSAELDNELSLGLMNQRRKFISSRTKEHKYAAYMESWRARVEQVGNINYPEAARQRRLSGNLVLGVAIRADGSIAEIDVVRSSGQTVLDQAAVRIVQMAAPFAPFSDDILAETDIIHITRTWQFQHNSRLIQN